jgi:hypothetical protein
MKTTISFLAGFTATALTLAVPVQADINSDLAFTAFHNVDLDSLAGGTVLQARGSLLTFPRGISSQALYVIDALPADVQSKLIHWNPASHPELKVWLHKSLSPVPTLSDFADIGNLPDNKSVQFQLDATAKMDPSNPGLQVSKAEADAIAAAAAQERDPRALFPKAWGPVLVGRINDFLSGRGAADSDMAQGGDIHPLSDVKSLLHADIKVYGAYQRLLNQTPARSLAAAPGAKTLPPADLYCDIFDVEGSAAMGTGAIYQAPAGGAIQSADIEYYTNYGVYTTIELEELWPVVINGKNETLVWRDDLVSAPNIAYLHGTERLASGMVMLQEVKGGIDSVRAEFK